MIVGEIMVNKFFAVSEDEEILEVMPKLTEERGTMVVCVVDDAGKLKGIITPKRMLKSVIMSEFSTIRQPSLDWGEVMGFLGSTRVGEIMGPPISVKPDDYVIDAIDIMIDKNLYTLPVVDDDFKLLGRVNFYNIIDSWARYLRKRQDAD